ncbi:phage antirepressor KilAC domain-containing protein [Paenibacillus sinopodophylli]|uniref:phage antirepressor KilAC domain-containing protein n=1 Tax=Paenibacillus sinopodophylli TaxID=1837342 RepID=UPI00110CD0A9|nr:phage antirepressor KilAC domain-containing protein [Paenibacillus sinopodophylli]
MNKLIMFEGHEVLVLRNDDVSISFKGDFIISAKDVAAILEYQGASATNEVLKFCKEEHIYKLSNSDMVNRHVRKLHNTGEKFISNFSLNRVLGQSGQPKAMTFQDWLYEDMLPTVQKQGSERIPSYMLEDPEDRAKRWIEEHRQRKELENQKILLENKIIKHMPKIAYLDTILQSKGTVTTTQIAKDYGLSGAELNKILHDLVIQYLVNKQWVLYSKHANKGYTQSYSFDITHRDGTPDVKMNTRWTQRGRIFIHEQITTLGIKANIEKEYGDAK